MREYKDLLKTKVTKICKITMVIPSCVPSLRSLPEDLEKIFSANKELLRDKKWKISDPFKIITYGEEKETVSPDWYFSVSNVLENELSICYETLRQLCEKHYLTLVDEK